MSSGFQKTYSHYIIMSSAEETSDPDSHTSRDFESKDVLPECIDIIHFRTLYLPLKSLGIDELKSHPDENIGLLLELCAVQDNLELLKEFLTPEWLSHTHSEDGNSLLQMALISKNGMICDYLLSIEFYPIDSQNNHSQTALGLAIQMENDEFYDLLCVNLLKKGASLAYVDLQDEYTILHLAIHNSLVNLAKFLIDDGCDVNASNFEHVSPLWHCLDSHLEGPVETELATCLLSYGADPFEPGNGEYNMFEHAIKFCSYTIEEAIFFYTYDKYTKIDLHLEILLKMAKETSSFFHEAIKRTENIILGRSSVKCYYLLFLIGMEYLDALIAKCPDLIGEVFNRVTPRDYEKTGFCGTMHLENMDLLVNNELLREDTIAFIQTMGKQFYFFFLIGYCSLESIVFKNLCYLLSYGLQLNESIIRSLYKRYRFRELLSIMLHMDIEARFNRRFINEAFLIFLSDITMTLEKYLQNPYRYSVENVFILMSHFRHQKLKELCVKENVHIPRQDDSSTPLLQELARNVFRKYLIKTFNIQSVKQFLALLNGLPISKVHKKIITYETELYPIKFL